MENRNRGSLAEIALLFLRLGTVAFGGPAAHIALMEEEVVARRGWISREKFLDLLGASNLIPGPNSTELAIHIGHLRGGWPGLIIAGVSFIIPAMLLVMAIAWAYVTYGSLPQIGGVLYGVKPVIIAVVLHALWSLGKTALKTRDLVAVAVISLMLAAMGMNEILVMILAGVGLLAARRVKVKFTKAFLLFGVIAIYFAATSLISITVTAASRAIPFSLSALFWFFVKVGSVLYGSGYVLLAFLQSGLVEDRGWLTQSQLLDAVAVGQVTPGPVFTTATFVGYVLHGPKAALIATLGIFLPAFIFVALSAPLIPRLRNSPVAGIILDGVNVASLALMAYVTWQLGRSTLIDLPTVSIALVSALLLLTAA